MPSAKRKRTPKVLTKEQLTEELQASGVSYVKDKMKRITTSTPRSKKKMPQELAALLKDSPDSHKLLRVEIPDPTKPHTKVDLWEIVEAILPVTRRALLFGPPATGKTHIATHIHMKTRTVYSVTLTESTPDAELRGHFVPSGGDFKWMDGPAIKAWRDGGCLVLNEINRASADALSFCYVLLDDPKTARVTLPTGETVAPHPNFRAVATMNGNPDELPEALRDRFPVQIEVLKTNPHALEALPQELRDMARGTMDLEANRRITMRSWLAFAEAVYEGGVSPDIAGAAIFKAKWADLRSAVLLRLAQMKAQLMHAGKKEI